MWGRKLSDSDHLLINESRYGDSVVPHVEQVSSWDCGLAATAMVLQGLGVDATLPNLRKLCPVNSVWSIDLAFLLRNYVEDFTYYTSFLGSRQEYKKDKFYQEDWNEDEKRVNKLFAIAKSCNVRIVRMVLPLDDFKRFLYFKKFGIIALVNVRLLKCKKCKTQKGCLLASGCFEGVLERIKGYDYVGHYIVLISYDPTEDVFVYRDPAVNSNYCTILSDDFDRARQAEGTDCDCIVVKLMP